MSTGTHTSHNCCSSFESEHYCGNVSKSPMLESVQSDIVFLGLFSKCSVLGSAGCDAIDHPEKCEQTSNHKICLLDVIPLCLHVRLSKNHFLKNLCDGAS
jgi:hypothetical protein